MDPAREIPAPRRAVRVAVGVGLLVAVLFVFWPVLTASFTNFDDDEYVTDNPWVSRGLTLDGARWAATTTYAANWHPLTWLSHMLDVQAFGLDPRGHHLTSVLLHAINSILLFLLLERMTRAPWRSGLVAALFAVHPLHVESVAWVAERKDVLSALFGILTVAAYLAHAKRPRAPTYGLTIVAFAAALASKPMLVTLPLVLLMFDYWPLGRFDRSTGEGRGAIAWPLVREKIPLFFLSLASSVVTLLAQRSGGAIGSFERYPFPARLANAVVAYVVYLYKAVFPSRLAVFYPHPGSTLPLREVIPATVLVVSVTAAAFVLRKSRPYLLVGWLFYLVTLVPVIGVVQVGEQALADRYTYLPLLGPFVAAVWLLSDLRLALAGRARVASRVVTAIAAVVLVVLGAAARVQASCWKDSITLFEHAVRVTDRNDTAHLNLAMALASAGRLEDAVIHYERALEIRPDFARAHNNFANTLVRLGRENEAIEHYRAAVRLDPGEADPRVRLANLLGKRGQVDEAIAQFTEALRIRPGDAVAHYGLGTALVARRSFDEAIAEFRQAIEEKPAYAEAHYNLGAALYVKGQYAEAWEEMKEARKLGYEPPASTVEMIRAKLANP